MKKFWVLPVALMIACAVAVTAHAANSNKITTSVSPSKSGTTSKPKPVGVKLAFQITDTENLRPLSLKELKIGLSNMVVNTKLLPSCTTKTITDAQSDAKCPAKALIGEGFANNVAGNVNNRADKSIRCHLTLRLWNAGSDGLALFVKGEPKEGGAADPKNCPIPLAVAIKLSVTKSGKNTNLGLKIPESLHNPGGGLRNSLFEMNLTIKNKSVKKNGKTQGVFATTGCSNKKRPVTFTFINESPSDPFVSGPATPQVSQASCTK